MFKTVCYVEHERLTATSEVVNTGEIMAFVGEDFVITVRHGRHGSLGPLREELEATMALAGCATLADINQGTLSHVR